MKTFVAAVLIGLAIVTFATPAAAHVVAVPASLPARMLADDDELRRALRSVVDNVLSETIAFSPTFVVVQSARVVGDRLYILFLIGDEEGQQMLDQLSADGTTP